MGNFENYGKQKITFSPSNYRRNNFFLFCNTTA